MTFTLDDKPNEPVPFEAEAWAYRVVAFLRKAMETFQDAESNDPLRG